MPYSESNNAQVIAAVLRGDLPKASSNVVYERDYGDQWEMIKCCWSRNVADRPLAFHFLSKFY